MDLNKIPADSKVRVMVEGYKTPVGPGFAGIKLRDEKTYSDSIASIWLPEKFVIDAEQVEELEPDAVYRDANGVYWQLAPTGTAFFTFGTVGAFALQTPKRPLEKMS